MQTYTELVVDSKKPLLYFSFFGEMIMEEGVKNCQVLKSLHEAGADIFLLAAAGM